MWRSKPSPTIKMMNNSYVINPPFLLSLRYIDHLLMTVTRFLPGCSQLMSLQQRSVNNDHWSSQNGDMNMIPMAAGWPLTATCFPSLITLVPATMTVTHGLDSWFLSSSHLFVLATLAKLRWMNELLTNIVCRRWPVQKGMLWRRKLKGSGWKSPPWANQRPWWWRFGEKCW